jgi:hypothetical protein
MVHFRFIHGFYGTDALQRDGGARWKRAVPGSGKAASVGVSQDMVLRVRLDNGVVRGVAGILAFVGLGLLTLLIVSDFVIGMFVDARTPLHRDQMESLITISPGSARLYGRLAEAELADPDRDLDAASENIREAIALSPYDYNLRLLAASIQEAAGDRAAAEASLRSARALAPGSSAARQRLGNLLLREDKLAESLEEFRAACAADDSLLPGTLDLVWRATTRSLPLAVQPGARSDPGGGFGAVPGAVATGSHDASMAGIEAATPADPASQMRLAQFLIKQASAVEAGLVFSRIDRTERLRFPETNPFLSAVIQSGNGALARSLWADLVGASASELPLIWNGGFELPIGKTLNQFDWTTTPTDYARVSIDTGAVHSGSRSLRIDFAGRDTTRLDGEIKQLIVLRPGGRYRLEFYVRTEGLVSPEGPRIQVAESGSGRVTAVSDPVPAGTNDWRPISLEFTAPEGGNASGPSGSVSAATEATGVTLSVSVIRKPRFSYDEPTKGTVWLDDFRLDALH